MLSFASDVEIENDLQNALLQSKALLNKADAKIRSSQSADAEIKALKDNLENIKASYLLLQERFNIRTKKVNSLGLKAVKRHENISEGFQKALEEYISLVESLPSEGDISPAAIDQLITLLDKIVHKKKKPIFGTLPYKHLNYPAKEPKSDPEITPAYKGGDGTVTQTDLNETPESQFSEETVLLAQSLNWNPVAIYEWVKNNVETEWYWGCMKGAEETLRQESGNDCDQSTLLVALLRASGFPARYVRGVIELDSDRLAGLTGINDDANIAEFFQNAGIPFTPVVRGGSIGAFEKEHIWVESEIPYANYRGAILDEHGKTWLGLDTSIKVIGYDYNDPLDILQELSFDTIRDDYLGTVQTETPLEYLRTYISSELEILHPDLTYNDLLSIETLLPEIMNILPASLQYTQVRITDEYTQIPDELLHRVRFIARLSGSAGADNSLLDITLSAFELSNQSLALTYEPETVEDQQIIDSYGGLGNTPSYLVRLRPMLTLNGERLIVATDGLPMGGDFNLTIELISPNGTEKIENTHIVGNLSVIGIVAGKAVTSSEFGVQSEDKTAEQLLYEEAISYIDRWNQAEEELASLMQLALTRPIPAVVTLGGVIDVTYLLDTPHGFDWKGVYVDADLRTIEAVTRDALSVTGERQKTFMELSALEGSVLESRMLEDDFQVDSISTAELFGFANSNQIPIITIDSTNINTVLPTLPFDDNIKEDITNAVNQGLTVLIPDSEIYYEDWTGIGYIKENLETGEAGYMLSGMIAGGMTAWGFDRWPEYYKIRLECTFCEPPNFDPASARYIYKITSSDMQKGTVGEPLLKPLQVLVVDNKNKPVVGAEITFTVKAGGGILPNGGIAVTDSNGIASAILTLGQKTSDNPTHWWEDGYTYSQQVGENIVSAELPSGIKLMVPFTAYGFPGPPTNIKAIAGDGWNGDVLSYTGTAAALITDKYFNPVSNVAVDFNSALKLNMSECPNPNMDDSPLMFFSSDTPCAGNPFYGCEGSSEIISGKTDFEGKTLAHVMLGGTPDAIYQITATAGNLTQTFEQTTHAFGNCGGAGSPSNKLILQSKYIVDQYGNRINAGKVGETIPIEANIYFLREENTTRAIVYTCTDTEGEITSEIVCDKIVGARQYYQSLSFNLVSFLFDGIAGTSTGNGIFTSNYTIPSVGINYIPINAKASLDVQTSANTCLECGTYTEQIGRQKIMTIQVYGVDINVEPPSAVLIGNVDDDGNGYSVKDLKVNYTIDPPDYNASTAYVAILKDNELIAFIPSELSGAGEVTLSEGFQFNINNTYEAQVVLNYGTGVEMRSERIMLPFVEIKLMDDDPENTEEVEEIKFGDGSRAEKRYYIELASKGLAETKELCESLTGTIKVVDKELKQLELDESVENNYYPTVYPLSFVFNSNDNKCSVKFSDDNAEKEKFIVSNMSKGALFIRLLELLEVYDITVDLNDISVLYGGLGNSIEVEIGGIKKVVPIEPLGVIVLAIDGLRQDVLYPDALDKVQDGGQYRVNIEELSGFKQVLSGYGRSENEQQYVMLPEVTSIFPSITLASWASIFTGRMPGPAEDILDGDGNVIVPRGTGILGNEFFARDRSLSVPARFNNPSGIISFSSGAFKGFDAFPHTQKIYYDFIVPYQPDWKDPITPEDTPQNYTEILKPDTVFQNINEIQGVKDYFNEKGGDPVVVANLQYARGAYWLTWDIPSTLDLAEVMDKASWDKFTDYLCGRYMDGILNDVFSCFGGKRNDIPFSALTVWYLPGLDHEAHVKGMSEYNNYFIDTTDKYINRVVNTLKELDEFDNKIFIITSDHGHTTMPTDLPPMPGDDGKLYDADISGKFKVKDFDKKDNKYPELANNNLHIWELGEMFKSVGSIQGTVVWNKYKVLAPEEIADMFKNEAGNELSAGATDKTENAHIIAALNGPMAHVYVQNVAIGPVAEILKLMLQMEDTAGALKWLGLEDLDYKQIRRDSVGRLGASIDQILIRVGEGENSYYCVFDGLNNDGSVKCVPTDPFATQEYVNAWERIDGMNHADRSGDIVLLMKSEMSDINQRFSTGVSYKSWHGSLNPSDSYVPFIFTYPGGNKYEIDEILKKDTVCKADYSNCKGNWTLTDIVKGIITEQYE